MASIYDKQILSGSDLEKIEELNRQWQNTTDSNKKKQLHESAESVRAAYGYSGGADGSEFIVNDPSLMSVAAANNSYTAALKQAQADEQAAYVEQIDSITADGEKRLREAYIKNMQDSLGIGQKLRDAGITGGATESTVAYMNNIYNTSRQDIIADTLDNKNQAQREAAAAKTASDTEIARADKEDADYRAELLAEAKELAHKQQLERDELEFRIAADARDFEWKKLTDQRDFDYQKKQDEAAAELAKQKASTSSSSYSKISSSNPANLTVSNVISLIKAGAYDEKFAPILGISDEEVRAMSKNYSEADKRAAAWDLLENGVYDESFPELLGYSEDILLNYVNSYLSGY